MKTVILVSMDYRRPQDGKTSLGVASMTAALMQAGVPVVTIDEMINDPKFCRAQVLQRVQHAIEATDSECLVGVGVFVWNEPEVQYLIAHLGARARVQVVLGGPQISYMPKGGLEQAYPDADVFVRGQGERAMVQLALGADVQGCGVHIADMPDLGLKADHNLNVLPSPYLEGSIELASEIRWETQRGCPFKCAFCQHREPGNRLKNQLIGQSRLEQELELFVKAGVKRISVLDPIFHANAEHAIPLLYTMKRLGLKAQLSLQCRFEMVTPAFLDALDGLNVQLEFGLQTVIPQEYRAIGRPNNMPRVEQVIVELHRRSIDFEVSLIYGLPHQTLDSFKASLDWCERQAVPRVRAWPLMLLRGTPLYEQKDQFGFVESTDQRIPIVVASHSFTEVEYQAMAALAASKEQ